MNKTTMNKEFAGLSAQAIQAKVEELRTELLKLRLKVATTPVASFASEQRALKKAIARALTHMRAK